MKKKGTSIVATVKRAAAVYQEKGRELVRHSVLKALVGGSKQIPDFDFSKVKDVVAPKYDPVEWAEFIEMNTRAKTSVRITALNTVGLGWSIRSEGYDDMTDEEKQAVDARASALISLFERPNPRDDFTTMITHAKIDHLSTGNAYVEAVRDTNGQVVQLFHMKAGTVRRTQADLYVQKKYRAARFFKPFGDKRRIDWRTGKTLPEGAKAVYEASEVIHLAYYSSADAWYGVPPAVTAQVAIAGSFQVDRRNYDFFESDALPRFAVLMSGGDDESLEAVEKGVTEFVKHVRGETKVSRALVLQGPAGRPGADKAQIEIKEMGQYAQDATFREYRRDCNEEIREVFGLAKVLYGTADDVNRASALATLDATTRNVFWPQSKGWGDELSCVAREFHPSLRLEFVKATATDLLGLAQITKTNSESGVFTVNELRVAAGKSEIEEDWANVPLVQLRAQGATEERQENAESLILAFENRLAEIRKGKHNG
jgi:capsid portal protein